MKKNKPKRRYTRLIDLILNMILLAICAFTIWKTYALGMLPMNWLLLITAAVAIVFLIFFILMFFRMPKWGIVIKRIFLVILCAIIAFAGYSLKNVGEAVDKVSLKEQSSTITLSVLVKNDSAFASLDDLSGAVIGIQNGTDRDNSNYAMEKLNAKLSYQPTYKEYIAYNTCANEFLVNYMDAMIVSSDYLEMLEANVEGFEGSYKILDQYERERPVNASDNKDITKESFSLLISGVDEMGAADMESLSDVNILLFVNPVSNSITMISLPRDSFMPRYSMNYANDKLTHTGWGGIEDTKKTVEYFFGIDIDYYAKVSFSSLIEIIDSIDGIDVDVEISFTEQDENRSFADEDLITLEAGPQHLNGKQALAYARHRKTEGYDIAGRERAQERIIKAIIDKLLTPTGITMYVNKLMETVPKYVVTSMPGKQITSFIKGELNDLKPWTITSLPVHNGLDDRRLDVPNQINTISSCYLWNQYDYRHVLDAYAASKKNLDFDFNFDFGDYTKYYPQIPTGKNLVWDIMAVNPY